MSQQPVPIPDPQSTISDPQPVIAKSIPPYYASIIEGRYGLPLRLFFKILFSRIRLLPFHVLQVQDLAQKGTVVYVLKSRSGLECLLYHDQARRNGLPVPVFACDSNMTLFHSLGFFLRSQITRFSRGMRGRSFRDPFRNGYVQQLIRAGRPVIMFLQDEEAFTRRFLRSGRDPLLHVLEVQKQQGRPIFMVPQMVIWERGQERKHSRLDELILGKRSNPPGLRVLLNFFKFYRKDPYISQAEPLEVKAFLNERPGMPVQELALDLRKELLERLRKERRLATGPVALSRQEIMERVLFDERVQQAIERRIKRKGKPEKAVRKEAYRLIREIAADLDPILIRFWDWVVTWALRNLYEGLEVDREGLERVRQEAHRSNLVLVPCHKSHMDYMILAYVLYRHYLFPPLIAAGLNLAFWPMGFLFRRSGAFFIRREFRGSVLYPAVFNRYLRVLLEEGYPLEFFIEGGRSRSGKMIPPKMGFLSMLIDGWRAGACKDISFVPVAISYERILEEGAYLKEVEGKEKAKESFWELLKSRHVIRKRYGKIYVTFNEPVSLKAFMSRTLGNPDSAIRYTRHNVPYYLAYEIGHKINEVVVVVPIALTAAAILCSPSTRGFTQRGAMNLAQLFYRVLQDEGARFSSSLSEEIQIPKILKETLEFLQKDRLLQGVSAEQEEGEEEDETLYEIHSRNRRRLDYYKNSILHYLLPYAFSSASLLAAKVSAVPLERFTEDAAFLRDLFGQEFVFLPEEDLEGRILLTLDRMSALNLVRPVPGGFALPPGRRQDLLGFARLIQSYFESYFIVGSSLKHISKRRLSQRRLLWRVRFTGHRLYQTGKIRLPESLSHVNYTNAIQHLVDQKIIIRQVDKTFREGTYFSLTQERRKIHWRKIKTFLQIYR